MAIENTYLTGSGVQLGTSHFDLQAQKPLDSRTTVPAFAGLQALIVGKAAYEGMIVYDEETKKYYQAKSCDEYVIDDKTYNLVFDEFFINENIKDGEGKYTLIQNAATDKTNKAVTEYSVALGRKSAAGQKGYYLKSINADTKTIYLSSSLKNDANPQFSDTDNTDTTFETPGYKVGSQFSIRIANHYDFCGTIKSISNNKVEYNDDLPFTAFAGATDDDENAFFVPTQPDIGLVEINQVGYAEGRENFGSGPYSHAEGRENVAGGSAAHAEGRKTKAGYTAHSEGYDTKALGQFSHAEGHTTTATGSTTHTEGRSTKATAEAAHAEGNTTQAAGVASHTEGFYTKTLETAKYAHAEGQKTIVEGIAAHAEGGDTQAIGDYSHAEGQYTKAEYISHAEGSGTQALQTASHAEGSNTIARGQYSHAEGFHTEATYDSAHAQGKYTIASSEAQSVSGKANIVDGADKYIEIVGNGADAENRSNAYTLDWQGNARFKGDVYVQGTQKEDDGTVNKKLATEDYVKNEVANLVNSAPETLDTLGELAQALKDNEDGVVAITNELAKKANRSTTLSGYNITDAYTKSEVDELVQNSHIGYLWELYNYANGIYRYIVGYEHPRLGWNTYETSETVNYYNIGDLYAEGASGFDEYVQERIEVQPPTKTESLNKYVINNDINFLPEDGFSGPYGCWATLIKKSLSKNVTTDNIEEGTETWIFNCGSATTVMY